MRWRERIIGASVITVHLLISHPQATLDSGTVLLFTLNRAAASGPRGSNRKLGSAERDWEPRREAGFPVQEASNEL